MSSPAAADSPVTVSRIPDPAEPVPAVAWPTLLLLLAGLVGYFACTIAGIAGALWAPLAILGTAIFGYLLFTVSHDAAHHSASSGDRLNLWMGRLSTPFFAPQASFAVWRFIHMQHHRFTNHHDGSDPDAWTMGGPRWQWPFRWQTVDLQYLVFYVKRIGKRPAAERRELAVQLVLVVAVVIAFAATGHIGDFLLFVLLPQRIAIMWLAYAFDYLPHNGLHHKPTEDRLKTTRNRVGGERWLSPVLLYQNYHLVHHLHPLVPFYRYIAVWRRNEGQYLSGDPALSTVGGRPITSEEYRQMRQLIADHDT